MKQERVTLSQVELKQLQREVGITFLYVTHDQEEALAMSERIAVLQGGRLEQVGTPEEVYLRPATRFVARFLGEANLLDGEGDGQGLLRWGDFAAGGQRLAALVPPGYPLAYYVARSPLGRRERLLLLVVIPFWTNFLVRTYAWIVLLCANGVINTLLLGLGLVRAPLPLLLKEGAVQAGLVYTLLPLMVLPLYANLEKHDQRLLETRRPGRRPVAGLLARHLAPLPPGRGVRVPLVFISAFGIYLVPDLMGGARSIMPATGPSAPLPPWCWPRPGKRCSTSRCRCWHPASSPAPCSPSPSPWTISSSPSSPPAPVSPPCRCGSTAWSGRASPRR